MPAARTKTALLLAALLAACCLPLAAHTRTAENSPLGLGASVTGGYRAAPDGNLHNALGFEAELRLTRVRSRCTAKLRDYESGLNLDYFGAKYYAGARRLAAFPNGDVTEREWAHNKAYGLSGVNNHNPNNPFVRKKLRSVANSSDVLTKTAITNFYYDKNGNLLEKIEYDWVNAGVENGSTIRRKTTNAYWLSTPVDSVASDHDRADWHDRDGSIWSTATTPRRRNALKYTKVSDTSVKSFADFTYDNAYTTGNLTPERRWDNTVAPAFPGETGLSASNSVVRKWGYDGYGNVDEIGEQNGESQVWTQITYNASGTRPSSVTRGDTSGGVSVRVVRLVSRHRLLEVQNRHKKHRHDELHL